MVARGFVRRHRSFSSYSSLSFCESEVEDSNHGNGVHHFIYDVEQSVHAIHESCPCNRTNFKMQREYGDLEEIDNILVKSSCWDNTFQRNYYSYEINK